jgi:NADH-quinone oxidoreductase subunit A
MALIFIIFDVEIVAILPPAVVFRSWVDSGLASFALVEIFLFVAILAVGLVYVWRKGDIDWIKDIPEAES